MGENPELEIKKTINQIVSKVREEVFKKFNTKTDFAHAMKKSPGWLNNKLKGHRKMSVEDLILIAMTLNLELEDLFPKNKNQINLDPTIKYFQTVVENMVKNYLKNNKIKRE